jgi:hypothetical protein
MRSVLGEQFLWLDTANRLAAYFGLELRLTKRKGR